MSDLKQYQVILADPPWTYQNKAAGSKGKSSSNKHYDVMTLEEIKAMPVAQLCTPDSVLFMWCTVPLILKQIPVLYAWGFDYKTMLTWAKPWGMGNWFRVSTEHVLVGVKGKPKPLMCQERNWIAHKRSKHSKKPEAFHELIELATLDMEPKLEMFGREHREGWDSFGNELEEPDLILVDNEWYPI